MKIDAVLFDFDDTLYDYTKSHEAGLKSVYSLIGKKLELSFEQFLSLYNTSKKEIKRELSGHASSHNRVLYFQRFIEKTQTHVDSEMILDMYNAYWDTFLKKMTLFPDTKKVFKALKKKKIKIGIVTDLTAQIQLRKLHHLKISKYIDVLVTSEEAGHEKPHPSIFLFALHKLGAKEENVVVVGDNPKKDIEGANAVGMKTILITKGSYSEKSKKDLEQPTFAVLEFGDILETLKKISKGK